MFLKEVMQRPVRTIRPESTMQETGEVMKEYDVNCLVVVNGSGKLVGIITNSDIIRKVVAKGDDIRKVTVSDVMTKDVIVASPDATLEEAADVMNRYKIKHLPIVDKESLVGIVTTTDLITYEEALVERVAALLLMKRDGSQDVGG